MTGPNTSATFTKENGQERGSSPTKMADSTKVNFWTGSTKDKEFWPSKSLLLTIRADGKLIEGHFKEGKAHGHVTLTEKNGKSRKAVYTKG